MDGRKADSLASELVHQGSLQQMHLLFSHTRLSQCSIREECPHKTPVTEPENAPLTGFMFLGKTGAFFACLAAFRGAEPPFPLAKSLLPKLSTAWASDRCRSSP